MISLLFFLNLALADNNKPVIDITGDENLFVYTTQNAKPYKDLIPSGALLSAPFSLICYKELNKDYLKKYVCVFANAKTCALVNDTIQEKLIDEKQNNNLAPNSKDYSYILVDLNIFSNTQHHQNLHGQHTDLDVEEVYARHFLAIQSHPNTKNFKNFSITNNIISSKYRYENSIDEDQRAAETALVRPKFFEVCSNYLSEGTDLKKMYDETYSIKIQRPNVEEIRDSQ